MKEAKIITQFKLQARTHFDSDKELEDFLYTPEHFWSAGDHTQELSPAQFLTRSRRKDKLQFVLDFVVQMKQTIEPSGCALTEALKPVYEKQDPDYILEGNKWWIDKDTCRYINSKPNLINKKIVAFFVKLQNESIVQRVVVQDQKVLHETTSLETQACFIDMLNVANG